MSPDVLIEGFLFYKAEPQKKSTLERVFSLDSEALASALAALALRLEAGGTRLVITDTTVELVTAPTLAPFIEALRKQDMKSDIGKAGAETLAIILYHGSTTRAEIDRLRGVNSSFILRNLLVRGLIERSPDKTGGGYRFNPSTDLLAHLGVTSVSDLPEIARIKDALESFVASDTATDEAVALT